MVIAISFLLCLSDLPPLNFFDPLSASERDVPSSSTAKTGKKSNSAPTSPNHPQTIPSHHTIPALKNVLQKSAPSSPGGPRSPKFSRHASVTLRSPRNRMRSSQRESTPPPPVLFCISCDFVQHVQKRFFFKLFACFLVTHNFVRGVQSDCVIAALSRGIIAAKDQRSSGAQPIHRILHAENALLLSTYERIGIR